MAAKKMSRNSRFFVQAAFLLLFLTCLAAFLGCSLQSSVNSDAASSSDSQTDDLPKRVLLHVNASLSKECTFESLWGDSDLVASGRYWGKSEPFLVIPVVGGLDAAMYYTDYFFEIGETYKGEAKSYGPTLGDTTIVAVRAKGGAGERVTFENDNIPELREDSEYLLFLYRVLDGMDGNTKGNHYYSFGDKLGIWKKDGESFSNADVGSVDMSTLAAMPMSDAIPASEQNLKSEDAMIGDIRNRYAAGEIDKKALDSYEELYEASRNGFATIATDDEVEAFEAKVVGSSVNPQSTQSS